MDVVQFIKHPLCNTERWIFDPHITEKKAKAQRVQCRAGREREGGIMLAGKIQNILVVTMEK